MFGAIPWKAIGAGVLILAIIGAALGLINFGRKYEKQKAEIAKLELENDDLRREVTEATKWKDSALVLFGNRNLTLSEWQLAAMQQQEAFDAAMARRPEVRYETIIERIPVEVPLGDCNAAAVASWKLLNEAGIAGVPP